MVGWRQGVRGVGYWWEGGAAGLMRGGRGRGEEVGEGGGEEVGGGRGQVVVCQGEASGCQRGGEGGEGG